MRKYQSFNSSCAFAGIANLLLQFGVEIEDRDIIIKSNAAYQVLYNNKENTFAAGYKVQGKYWFNSFLNTIGFQYTEVNITIDDYISNLKTNFPTHIIGLWFNDIERHVVNFECVENNKYKFLNNKWIDSDEEDFFYFTEKELRDLNRHRLKYGYLQKLKSPCNSFDKSYFLRTITNIDSYLYLIKSNLDIVKEIDIHQKEKELIYRTFIFRYSINVGNIRVY